MKASLNTQTLLTFFRTLQSGIVEQMKVWDANAHCETTDWERPEGGGGRTIVFSEGPHIEKGGVNFSHVMGEKMPASATAHRPNLAGASFEAMGVSLVIHPRNPHIPTTHMNVRYFSAVHPDAPESAQWWFGGGYDLTPFYPVKDDIIGWHQQIKKACDPHGTDLYAEFKAECDRYFYLNHRKETRGIGGLFFDDFNRLPAEASFAFVRSIGESFWPNYAAIIERRTNTAFTERERQFQLYRRGRYVEFNLLQDRGTLFGLQSGGNIESILMSLPPLAAWTYNFQPTPNSAEARLSEYLQPRDWLGIKP
jgi:coproporphyrinogen III oxidase